MNRETDAERLGLSKDLSACSPPSPLPRGPELTSFTPGTCPDPHQESTSEMEEKSLDEAPMIF